MVQKLRFMYNGKQYQTSNLEKQLQRMGITENDIEIIQEKSKEFDEVKTYTFKNKVNGHTIVSIEPDMEHLKHLYNLDEWEIINV